MLIWDCPDLINEWVAVRLGGFAHPGKCTALGWVSEGKLVGGLVFYDSNGQHCMVNIALENGHFPLPLLKTGLEYTFKQLQLKRLTFIISEGNMPSINLVTRLGATLEATLRAADKTGGNLLIYALFPSDCKIWSRLNGKILRQCAAST